MRTYSFIHILQLEEYQLGRFLKWSLKNPLGKKLENKKPLVWTEKARFIAIVALLWYLVIGGGVLERFGMLGLLIDTTLILFPWFFILLAVLTRIPYELINRKLIITKTRKKISYLKSGGLKIIGITGSYGKTTTKEFLYQILKSQYHVLRTPESYNTLFGIRKVIDLELDNSYDFFICEMGAYKIGEIKEICQMVLPDYAILTGINEQHLERFRKIENTIKAKFELIQAVDNKDNCLLNRDCKIITDNYSSFIKVGYSDLPDNLFYGLGDISISNSNLIGKANITNVTAASKMAEMLGVDSVNIKREVALLKPVPHRLEVKRLDNGWTILDDAYNSNIDGFKQALATLATFKGTKIIATPGIVELGKISDKVHKELGGHCENVCDYIILVGKNERTAALEKGILTKSKVVFIDSINQLNKTVEHLKISLPVILIENDLTDNY